MSNKFLFICLNEVLHLDLLWWYAFLAKWNWLSTLQAPALYTTVTSVCFRQLGLWGFRGSPILNNI